MRWGATIVFFFALVYSAISSDNGDQPYLHVMARSSVYNAGEKKAIYCKGLNLPEKVEWYSPSGAIVEGRSTKNTRIFVERNKSDTSKSSLLPLFIQSTQIKDSGNWTCKAGDFSETIEILVGEKVYIPVRNENIQGEENKYVKLDCVAKGSPEPVVQWYKDMVPIPDNPKKYVLRKKEDNYQLEIKNLNHLDTAEYVCKVTQEKLSHYTDKRVQLTVQHKPLLMDAYKQNVLYLSRYRTQEVYAILNETKNITCSAIAYPPPTYTWIRRKNGYDVPLQKEDTIYQTEEGSVLVLRMYNESYLGEYQCSVENNRGHVYIIYHVTLGNKPQPPDYVELVAANVTELTFNVTCENCTMAEEAGISPQPNNLKVLGYSFQFVPVRDDYPTPEWDEAIEILVDIEDPEVTTFDVGPLPNSTTFHARVRTRNAAGFSDWINILNNPATTDHAVKLLSSLLLVIIAVCFATWY